MEKIMFSEWFDPTNKDHVKALITLNKTGVFPVGFIPDNVDMDTHWTVSMFGKIAVAYVDLFSSIHDRY